VILACGPTDYLMSLFQGAPALFLLLLAPFSLTAQESISIKVAGGAVLVPVRVNDRNLNFVLDTGRGAHPSTYPQPPT
jgi:hypothetical protein